MDKPCSRGGCWGHCCHPPGVRWGGAERRRAAGWAQLCLNFGSSPASTCPSRAWPSRPLALAGPHPLGGQAGATLCSDKTPVPNTQLHPPAPGGEQAPRSLHPCPILPCVQKPEPSAPSSALEGIGGAGAPLLPPRSPGEERGGKKGGQNPGPVACLGKGEDLDFTGSRACQPRQECLRFIAN